MEHQIQQRLLVHGHLGRQVHYDGFAPVRVRKKVGEIDFGVSNRSPSFVVQDFFHLLYVPKHQLACLLEQAVALGPAFVVSAEDAYLEQHLHYLGELADYFLDVQLIDVAGFGFVPLASANGNGY